MAKVVAKEQVKVTRKYQVTIPTSVRSKLGIKIGDKLIVRSEGKRIIMEVPQHVSNPSDVLWNIFGKPLNIDATKLIEESWKMTYSPELAKLHKTPNTGKNQKHENNKTS